MINCPKCGFSQPPDQFCAKCGVNVQTYIPKAIPVHMKMLKSPGVRTTAFILVIAVGILFVQKNYKFNDTESQTFSTWEDSEKSAPDINGPEKKMAGTTDVRAVRQESSSNNLLKSSEGNSEAAAKLAANPKSSSWQVIFLEVPRNSYEEHLAPLESFADGNMHGGMVNNSEEFLKNLKGVRELMKEIKSLKNNEPWEIFKGIRSYRGDDQDLGIHLQLQQVENADGQTIMQFSYVSQIPIFADRKIASVEPQGLVDSVRIPPKGGLFLTGGISRKAGGEDYPLTGAPFDILQSPRFKESESEFVILILSK